MPKTITPEDLCRLVNLSDRRLRDLSRAGWFAPKVKGEWGTETITGVVKYYQQEATKSGLSTVRVAREKEKLRRETVQADEAEKRVVPTEEVNRVWSLICNGIRTRMLAIPSGTAPYLVGLTDVLEIENRLKAAIKDGLNELSRPTFTNSKPRRK